MTIQGGSSRTSATGSRIAPYRRFIEESDAAGIAGRLMRSTTVRLYHDHVLVKEPGTRTTTPWHQDQPYYNIDGRQNVSMWLPLDPVARESTLEFVAGSHLGPWLMPRTFMDHQAKWFPEGSLADLPDIDGARDAYRILGWELNAGDAVFFHMLTLHSAGGVAADRRRRAFSVRFLGDDIVHAPRQWETSPPFPGPGRRVARRCGHGPSSLPAAHRSARMTCRARGRRQNGRVTGSRWGALVVRVGVLAAAHSPSPRAVTPTMQRTTPLDSTAVTAPAPQVIALDRRLEDRRRGRLGVVRSSRPSADAHTAAESAANLIVGPFGPGYGDRDGDGTTLGTRKSGLLPGLEGRPRGVAMSARRQGPHGASQTRSSVATGRTPVSDGRNWPGRSTAGRPPTTPLPTFRHWRSASWDWRHSHSAATTPRSTQRHGAAAAMYVEAMRNADESCG